MSLRKKAKTGFVWTFAQQSGNQVIGFVISLILARLLMPEEFGLIGMITIFIAIGNALLNAGLTQSLIRGENLTEDDYSTVFYFNLAASITVYLIVFLLAPFIAEFYGEPLLDRLIKVYCLSFIFSAFSAVQFAMLTKKFDFKTQTMVTIPSTLLGGGTGVVMAYSGFGVWSLVGSSLVTTFFRSFQVWIYSKWKPALVFNIDKFRKHFDFGYKILLSGIIDKIFSNIFVVVIGKYFSSADVGFYTRAENTQKLPLANIFNSLDKISYPMFAEIQNDNHRLKKVYKELLQMVVFTVSPVLLFMAVLGEPLFRFLFTEKWLPAVPFFQIICITGVLYPLHAYNLSILNVKGRSDLFLKLEIYKKIIVVITIVVTIPFGILALLYGQVAISVIAVFINSYYTGKFIKYGVLKQLKDVTPIILLAVLASSFIYVLETSGMEGLPDLLRLIIGTAAGLIVYIGIAFLFKMDSFRNLKKLIFKR